MYAEAISDEAIRIQESIRESENQISNYISFSKRSALDELLDVWQDCETENWDGQGALAVARGTYLNGCAFIDSLPIGSPLPAAGAEPDGHLTFEWHVNPRKTLSVSIGPDRMLYYSALIGSDDPRGSSPFYGETPESIISLIRRVYKA